MRFCSLNTDCSSLRQGRLLHSYADVVVALMTFSTSTYALLSYSAPHVSLSLALPRAFASWGIPPFPVHWLGTYSYSRSRVIDHMREEARSTGVVTTFLASVLRRL